MNHIKEMLHLHLFDGAEGGAEAGDGGFANLEGSDSTVVYGKQTEEDGAATVDDEISQVAADEDTGENTQDVDRDKDFKDLIKGEYKEEYQKLFESQLNNRMKRYSGMEEELERSNEVLSMLYGVYGVQDGDIDELAQAIQYDDNLISAQAEAAGLTPDQFRYQLYLQQEAEASQRMAQEAQQQAFINQQVAEWEAQAEEMKSFIPDFDLVAECQEPEFVNLLQSGISVRAAFNAIHADEIIEGTIAQTAQSVRQSVTDNIKARGQRPAENGTVTRPGVIVKNDPTKFTKKDREEIVRRVARGETIAL